MLDLRKELNNGKILARVYKETVHYFMLDKKSGDVVNEVYGIPQMMDELKSSEIDHHTFVYGALFNSCRLIKYNTFVNNKPNYKYFVLDSTPVTTNSKLGYDKIDVNSFKDLMSEIEKSYIKYILTTHYKTRISLSMKQKADEIDFFMDQDIHDKDIQNIRAFLDQGIIIHTGYEVINYFQLLNVYRNENGTIKIDHTRGKINSTDMLHSMIERNNTFANSFQDGKGYKAKGESLNYIFNYIYKNIHTDLVYRQYDMRVHSIDTILDTL